jgi:hypothetical protein
MTNCRTLTGAHDDVGGDVELLEGTKLGAYCDERKLHHQRVLHQHHQQPDLEP